MSTDNQWVAEFRHIFSRENEWHLDATPFDVEQYIAALLLKDRNDVLEDLENELEKFRIPDGVKTHPVFAKFIVDKIVGSLKGKLQALKTSPTV